MICEDCAQPLTKEEIYYYETRCEQCTQAWDERIRKWIKGETIEPELDNFYSGNRKNNGL